MKIKIIDLLIMIANDNAPKKFRYKRKIWKITDFDEVEYENNYTYFFKENLDCLITKHLNDEVEIIEDEVEIVEEDIKENPTFEEYMENPEKYWNNLLEKLDEIKQYLKND